MNESVLAAITKSINRKLLFHFTRARNLPVMAHYDALLCSSRLAPESAGGERRIKPVEVYYFEHPVTVNPHLRIPESMLNDSVTLEQFRAYLDRHVFFWPTIRDCRKMMSTYARREPGEPFAVLSFDAFSLLAEHYPEVKLSKYDSGSSPRYPIRCSYKKSLDMFLPLEQFKIALNNTVPAKASEIREILVEGQVNRASNYLQAVYADNLEDVPAKWKGLARPLSDLQAK